MVINLPLLLYLKYTVNINSITSVDIPRLIVYLPLVISFFIFQQISFLINSYKDETYDNISYSDRVYLSKKDADKILVILNNKLKDD